MLKNIHIHLFVLILGVNTLFAQTDNPDIKKLIEEGVQLHDAGKYTEAIEKYKEVLKTDKNNTTATYEISYSYSASGDNENAVKYSKMAIKLYEKEKKSATPAYVILGSALDNMGKSKESVKVYEEALLKDPEEHLLHYNLGITYANMKELDKAEISFTNSIKLNKVHTSSHLALASIMYSKNKKPQAALAFYYALLIESNKKRAEANFVILDKIMKGNVSSNPDKPNEITINLNSLKEEDDGFQVADMLISMVEVTRNSDENKDKSDAEFFVEKTRSFFSVLGEQKDKKERKDIWWSFYIPFFYELAETPHIEAFSYYIYYRSGDKDAIQWLQGNQTKLTEFTEWLSDK